MKNSLFQSVQFECEKCGKNNSANVWLVVDASERPDLLEEIIQETIHTLSCPWCGNIEKVDAPLLVYRPETHPVLLFSSAQQTTSEINQRQAKELLGWLRQRIGAAWKMEWLDQMPILHRSLLPVAINKGVMFAMKQQELREKQGGAISLMILLQANTWEKILQVVEGYPELLSEEVDSLLEHFLQRAQETKDEKVIQRLKDDRAFLQRCREVGIKQAYSEIQASFPYERRLNEAALVYLNEEQRQAVITISQQANSEEERKAGFNRHPELRAAFELAIQQVQSEWKQRLDEIASIIDAPYSRKDMPQRIPLCQEALLFIDRSSQPELWASMQNSLGFYLGQTPQGDIKESLEQAICHFHQALEIYTRQSFSKNWADTQINLGNTYKERICGDHGENLEKAIHYYQNALEVYTRDEFPDRWAAIQNNLGNIYRKRIRGSLSENLEQAISCFQNALKVHTHSEFPADWAMVQSNLGTAYLERIKGDRGENLNQAVFHFEQALDELTFENFPEEWATIQTNLALSYTDRIDGEQEDNLEQGIDHFGKALEVHTRQAFPTEWAAIQHNLGNTYIDRKKGDKAENLEQAISHLQQALEVRNRDAFPLEWAITENGLGNAYQNRIRGNRSENVEQAISHFQQALEVFSRQAFPSNWAVIQHNLGNAYRYRTLGKRDENLKKAIYHYQQALLEDRPDSNPSRCRLNARWLGSLALEARNWEAAIQGFQTACNADETLFQAALIGRTKEWELQETRGIYVGKGYALAKTGNNHKAVEMFEAGRARLLREEMERNRSDLEQLREQDTKYLFDRYQQADQSFQALTARRLAQPSTVQLSDLESARQDLQTAIEAIRCLPGYQDFQYSLSIEGIQSVAKEIPLVYIATTSAGGLALVVQSNAITPIWLDELSESAVREQMFGPVDAPRLGGYLGAYAIYRDAARETMQVAAVNWRAVLDQMTAWLWDTCMGPIVQTLTRLGINRSVLIPSGLLGLLPLHASWTSDHTSSSGRHYAIDDISFSYAPSAYALRQAQNSSIQQVNTILAIDNPDNSLPSSSQEVDAALEHFPKKHRKRLSGNQATKQATLEIIPYYAVLHFSTHGMAGLTHPLEGYVMMASQEHLSLQEIKQLRLKQTRLAVLSACETAIPGINILDEVYNLPIGFLQAGVQGVIGSLWTVSEYSTMLLMTKFYENWQRGEKMSLAEALHQAQIWLRDSKVCDFEVYLRQSMRIPVIEKLPENVAHQVYWQLHDLDPNLRPFAHPYYWAAFSLTGI